MTISGGDPQQCAPEKCAPEKCAPEKCAPEERVPEERVPEERDLGERTPEARALPERDLETSPSEPDAASLARARARRLGLHFSVVLLAASALAAVLGGSRAAVSTALGVVLSGVNLLLMQKITSAMTGSPSGAGAAWGLALPFKLVALVGVAYALVSAGVAQPVPLAMGFALLPLTGVFLPRPTSVPHPNPGPLTRRAPVHPRRRREPTPSRSSQPAS